MKPTFDELSNITSNPAFAKMMTHEYAPALDFAYYNRFGTKEQKDLLGQYKTFANQVITDSVHKFGSRFTNADLGFLLKQKITESDSLPAAQGKLKAMMLMSQFATKRSERAAEIMQETLDRGGKKIPASKAIAMADKEMNGNKIRSDINKQVTGIGKYAIYLAPDNKTKITIPLDKVKEFESEVKDHKRIV